ncbi:ABC transporter ATP-binding protein [Rhizobium sp. 18065]|uniref:ABC transporter ATP-binding protein n=1 Tax=Rhizobium sp. 18065 TaxID=2681411 RepID=UPI00135B406C|nr:ABC transporter ATP-binding protein [Rhizobium sp. 18065]
MTNPLCLNKVSVHLGKTRIINEISLSLAAGQVVAVVGPNGAGKSTLLGAVAGAVAHTGRIQWLGGKVDRRKIGFMPQHCTVKAQLSVLQTLILARHEQLGWHVGAHDIEAAGRMLQEFGLEQLADRHINTLSGGQQQLVLLAQRLMRQPRLLILDEATCALDLRHQMIVLERLGAYVARTGALVLMAIHDLNLAARHTACLLLLEKGSLAGQGSASEVLTRATLRNVYGIEVDIVQHGRSAPFIIPVSPTSERQAWITPATGFRAQVESNVA